MRLCIETKKQCVLHKFKESQFKLQMNWKVSAFYDVAVKSPTSSSSLIITLPRCVLFTSWSISVSDFRPYAILHSTMYLLNRFPQGCGCILSTAFTFHNVSIKSADGNGRSYGSGTFTFHNVSIKSWRDCGDCKHHNDFTFHNVSIKSGVKTRAGYKTLHFTFHNVSIKSIRPHPDRYLNAPFTFHNVSIKSPEGVIQAGSTISFTFHNVSIKSSEQEEEHHHPCPFTFHNVSIKSLMIFKKSSSPLTLHSTMYLLNLFFRP